MMVRKKWLYCNPLYRKHDNKRRLTSSFFFHVKLATALNVLLVNKVNCFAREKHNKFQGDLFFNYEYMKTIAQLKSVKIVWSYWEELRVSSKDIIEFYNEHHGTDVSTYTLKQLKEMIYA